MAPGDCKLTVFLAAAVVGCSVAAAAGAVGGRRLLQNPDLPHQRTSNPTWMNPDGGSQSQTSDTQSQSEPQSSSQGQAQAQPQTQGQFQGDQDAMNDMMSSLGSSTVTSSPVVIFSGGQFGAGWLDSSYGVRPFTSFAPAGKDSGTASCLFLPVGAAMSFFGPQGSFAGKRALEFWAYAGSAGVADVDVVLSGASASCRHVPLSSVSIAESSSGWIKFWIDFNRFSWASQGSGSFWGCGSSGTSAGELVKVDFINPHSEYEALLCIDGTRLMP